jgi:hypothetical protein
MDKTKKKLYKIRDRITGLYSLGGEKALSKQEWDIESSWSVHGKIWTGKGPLNCHLSFYKKRNKLPASWEVIECELVESPSPILASDFK